MNALILLLATTTFSRLIPDRYTALLEKLLRYIIVTLTVAFVVTSFLYLLYPTYVDHVEPTLADLGMLFRKGEAIYAWPATYSLHGLLYGPGLTELQAAAQLLPVPLLISSKLPGVLPAAILALLFLRVTSSPIARGYILFFFLFADAALWNRADPILGLAAFVALLLTERRQMAQIPLFILLGVIAGICSSLKLHGALYIVPAFVMALSRQDKWLVPFAFFVIFAVATLLASFTPPS
jgi:hypothetical protein